MTPELLLRAEMDLVRSILADPNQWESIKDITPDRMLNPIARGLWRVVYKFRGNLPAVTLISELDTFAEGQYVLANYPGELGQEEIRALYIPQPDNDNAPALAEHIRQHAIEIEHEKISLRRDPGLTPSERAARDGQALLALSYRIAPTVDIQMTMTAVDRELEKYAWRQANPHLHVGWRTGNAPYDTWLQGIGGLDGGKLIVTGGFTGYGKSHWLINQALGLATHTHDDTKKFPKVVFFPLEMGPGQMAQRIMGNMAKVTLNQITTNPQAMADLQAARARYKEIDEEKRLQVVYGMNHLDAISRTLHRLRSQGECDIAVIDYLSILEVKSHQEGSYAVVGEIAKLLANLALALDIPILTAAQLNRSAGSQGSPPSMQNIADSIAIGYHCNAMHMMWRPEKSQVIIGKNAGHWKDVMVLITPKVRDGSSGPDQYYHINEAYSTFTPVSGELHRLLLTEEQQKIAQGIK